MGYNSSPKVRFIPAGAGNTRKSFVYSLPTPVHPRRCGEHRSDFRVFSSANGSSPQVRGTRFHVTVSPLLIRFIPAGAGNTADKILRVHGFSVHPRRCGEHWTYHKNRAGEAGSSPQVRGTLLSQIRTARCGRFIPAGAGNTSCACCGSWFRPVHPRRCGEHYIEVDATIRFWGSSPQVRGTPRHDTRHATQSRFIPAGAGNTCGNR